MKFMDKSKEEIATPATDDSTITTTKELKKILKRKRKREKGNNDDDVIDCKKEDENMKNEKKQRKRERKHNNEKKQLAEVDKKNHEEKKIHQAVSTENNDATTLRTTNVAIAANIHNTSSLLANNNEGSTTTLADENLAKLEAAYQEALHAFKADKTNKELRRARTAAKKAWDEARIASSSTTGQPIVCRNCSQLFIFDLHDTFAAREWDTPTQCKDCAFQITKQRSQSRQHLDDKQNMCFEFQRTGFCSRGDACKFSHKDDHVGKTPKKSIKTVPLCRSVETGEPCPHGIEKCRFRHTQDDPAN